MKVVVWNVNFLSKHQYLLYITELIIPALISWRIVLLEMHADCLASVRDTTGAEVRDDP